MDFANYWFSSGAGGGAAYEIEQSLRFDGSSYLSWTPSSAGNRATWTYSVWLKLSKSRATAGHDQCIFSAISGSGGSDSTQMSFNLPGQYAAGGYDDGLTCGLYSQAPKVTPNRYRDYSAWLHVVITRDQGNATLANSLRFYVNNVRVDESAYINLLNGTTTIVNSNVLHRIGEFNNYNRHFEGYMAEINFIDGTTVSDATDFGEYDDNGVWRPIEYTGSHGSNGFYLKFDPSASNGIGHDHSGNGNHWTPSGFNVSGTGTDVFSDTPTNNFATLIANNPTYGRQTTTPQEGCLKATFYPVLSPSHNPGAPALTTFLIPTTGKWYFEFTVSGSNNYSWGVAARSDGNELYNFTLSNRAFWGWYAYNGGGTYKGSGSSIYGGATGTASGGGLLSGGDVIGMAFDFTNNSLTITRNGSSYATITSANFTSYDYVLPQWGTATNGISGSAITLNAGQRAFEGTVPADHLSLCTANLPAPDIADGSANFNTKTYTGNGSTQTIPDVGFQPDLVWVKSSSQTVNHLLFDAVRGFGSGKELSSDNTNAEGGMSTNLYGYVSGVGTDSFSVAAGTNGANYVNVSSQAYVGWNWLAGNGTSSISAGSIDGTNPTIASTVSVNTTAGFSIVAYTGNGSNSQTVGHGLGVAPRMCIGKSRASNSWYIRHESLGSNLNLNFNNAGTVTPGGGGLIGDLTSSTTISLPGGSNPGSGNMNANGTNYIMYCFAEIEGYSKIGSYLANNSLDGPFVYCGFSPAFVIVKSISSYDWLIYDNKRYGYNVTEKALFPNQAYNEQSVGNVGYGIDFLSNGFKLRTSSNPNQSSHTYVYLALASNPFGGDGASPATAR